MSFRLLSAATVIAATLIFLLAAIYWNNKLFLATAIPTAVFLLTVVALNLHRMRLLRQTIERLDRLLQLLESTRDHLSFSESQRLHRELSEMRAALLRDQSLCRPGRRR